MKKIVSIIIASIMMVSCIATVSAAELTTAGSETGTVYAQYVASSEEVFKVTVTWDELEFVYTQGAWDGTQYTTGSWNKTSAEIGIENSSNIGVNYSAKFGNDVSATVSGVTATLSNNSGSLVSATADSGDTEATVGLAITGTPDEDKLGAEKFEVGTITVTISK